MYSLKHEQQCFSKQKTIKAIVIDRLKHVLRVFWTALFAASVLNEFIGEVILKINFNLIWDVKTSEKFIKNSERVFNHIIKHGFLLFYLRELLMSFCRRFSTFGLCEVRCLTRAKVKQKFIYTTSPQFLSLIEIWKSLRKNYWHWSVDVIQL